MRQPALWILAVLLCAAPARASAEAPAWCLAAKAQLRSIDPGAPDAWERYRDVVDAFPPEAAPLAEDARQRAGRAGSLAPAVAALGAALDDGCARGPSRAALDRARAEASAILEDGERFYGAREQEDLVDKALAWLGRWLKGVLESTAMRSYADTFRFVVLSLLGLLVLVVAARLWRARVREQARPAPSALVVERERLLAFAERRREADQRLAAGDLRGALRAGQMALLARLGEVDARAVTPARTNREILRHLDGAARDLAAPPLELFDRAFFGGRADPPFVERFLAAVDGAARALSGARP